MRILSERMALVGYVITLLLIMVAVANAATGVIEDGFRISNDLVVNAIFTVVGFTLAGMMRFLYLHHNSITAMGSFDEAQAQTNIVILDQLKHVQKRFDAIDERSGDWREGLNEWKSDLRVAIAKLDTLNDRVDRMSERRGIT